MTNTLPHLLCPVCIGIMALACPVVAQVPNTLLHSIPGAPAGASGDFFGNSVALSGNWLVIGAYQNDMAGTDAGSAFVYEISSATPLVPVFMLSKPSPTAADRFGRSVAISGTLAVVGADLVNTGATNAGSAYVYDLSSATPTVPVFTLNNPGPGVNDQFGLSVAIAGTWIVVGAPFDNTGATDAGSAYVYNLTSAAPTVPVVTLYKASPAVSDYFGVSVAISGTRVLVGADRDDTGATDAGSAYVYDMSSATPTVPAFTLNNPSPSVGDGFGQSVAISGTRVVVGALYDNSGVSDAGSAYVYDMSSAIPTSPVTTLTNPSPGAGDNFGTRVAITGSLLVVGAHRDDTGAADAGSAYVYDVNSATPTIPVVSLNNPGPATGDQFGYSVAIDGTTVAIGAPLGDATASDAGAAYIFGPNPLDQDNDGLLDSWELTYWSGTAGHSALDDSDHDGYCELLELAFGLDPTQPNPGGMPAPTDENGFLTMTITKQPGAFYEVQSAGTLLSAQPDSFSAASTTVITNNATTLKVRDNFLIGIAPGRFIRVKVTGAP